MRGWYQRMTPAQRRSWIARRDPERVRAADKARSTKLAKLESLRRSKARYPDRELARRAVAVALRRGRLERRPCHCGSLKVEAHHPDYALRLQVEWLCRRHHVERHPRALAQAAA
jgi:hypothetical protein